MKAQTALETMIGESAAMAKLRRTIGKVAARVHPVLIQGESGTGKELVARAIHLQSDRRAAPLSLWIAGRCRRRWRRASCSATSRAPSLAPRERKKG